MALLDHWVCARLSLGLVGRFIDYTAGIHGPGGTQLLGPM